MNGSEHKKNENGLLVVSSDCGYERFGEDGYKNSSGTPERWKKKLHIHSEGVPDIKRRHLGSLQ